jgi:hypothetical protein
MPELFNFLREFFETAIVGGLHPLNYS